MLTSIILIVLCLGLMVSGKVPAVLALAATLGIAGILGLAPVSDLAGGLSSSAVITIAAMLVIAKGVAATGIVTRLASTLLGGAHGARSALIRLLPSVGILSGLVNNTPVVALSIPAVLELEQTRKIPARTLLMPLSFAATLGGTLTLIGTSTNLISSSIAGSAAIQVGMLSFLPVAAPAFVGGLLVLWWGAPRWLRAHRSDQRADLAWRIEIGVPGHSALIGRSAAQARLADSAQYRLTSVLRGEVTESEAVVVAAGDTLVFEASEEGIAALWRNPMIGPGGTRLYQATIAPGFSGTIEDLAREDDIEVIAAPVHSPFVRAAAKPGTVVYLAAPDAGTLESQDAIALTTDVVGRSPRPEKTWPALAVFAIVVVLASTGLAPVEWVAVCGAVAMVAVGALSPHAAAKALDWNVLGITAGSIGLGGLFVASGLASKVAGFVSDNSGHGILIALIVLAGASVLLTNIVTNAAAASMMIPIAIDVAARSQLPALPIVVMVGVCASIAFANPIATPTNVMVQVPGRYRPSSFLAVGGVLTLVVVIIVVAATWFWIGLG